MTRSEAMESILLMHEMKNRGNYKEAFQLAMNIDEKFIKSTYDMIGIADICIQNKKYTEALKWLIEVRERSSSKRILIQLIYVCLKLNKLEEARYYYDIFLQSDEDSTDRYVLEYRIRKREGADYRELVGLLKKINEDTFSERWAFELAKLYHKMGDYEACVRECDRIVLWFGSGAIVEKAKMLSAYHKGELPETKTEEEENSRTQEVVTEEEKQEETVTAGTEEEAPAVAAEREPEAEETEPEKKEELFFNGVGLNSYFGEYNDSRLLAGQLEEFCAALESGTDCLQYYIRGGEEKALAFTMDLLRFLRAAQVIAYGKVAKISARKLNEISLLKQKNALKEATLLVTEAQELSGKSRTEIEAIGKELGRNITVVLVSGKETEVLQPGEDKVSFCVE